MNSKDLVLSVLRAQGRADALALRSRAADMTPTEIIAEEEKVPRFDPAKDYSAYPVGAPVYEEIDGERQIFTLIVPHNAGSFGGTPNTLRALWSLAHTKDPSKAKSWVAPLGTSGMYMYGEYCTSGGCVWRSTKDNNPYEPGTVGTVDYWEAVE